MTPFLYARMSTWKFKPGKRAEAVKIVEESIEEIRKAKGFRAIMTLLPKDDPNTAKFLAVWDSEEDLNSSQQGIYTKVSGRAMPLSEKPPELKNFEIPRALLALI